tara:strand:+ start:191 stop:661 length:471 start_codon:yes stop_codon:yes gene_type:complete
MHIKKKYILFYFIFSNLLHSQNYNLKNQVNDSLSFFQFFKKIHDTNLNITQSEKIKKITTIYNSIDNKKINVFKIQLNSLNDSRIIAQNDSTKYEKIFYPEKIEIVYETPYFKAKTNFFLNKIDAEKKLKEILKSFKNAFILKESIDIEELRLKKI